MEKKVHTIAKNEPPSSEVGGLDCVQLTPIEQLMIHVWRKTDLSAPDMIAMVCATANHDMLSQLREKLADILEIEPDHKGMRKLPTGQKIKKSGSRSLIEGMIYQIAIERHGITKAPVLKNELKDSDKAKYDRALGALRATFTKQVYDLVDRKIEVEVARRLPLEEAKYIDQMKEAMAANQNIWEGMPHVKALFDAFQPFLSNDKLMLQVLHPDLAPADRKEEFSKAMAIFNSVREALSKVSTTHRKLLEHIWPMKK